MKNQPLHARAKSQIIAQSTMLVRDESAGLTAYHRGIVLWYKSDPKRWVVEVEGPNSMSDGDTHTKFKFDAFHEAIDCYLRKQGELFEYYKNQLLWCKVGDADEHSKVF